MLRVDGLNSNWIGVASTQKTGKQSRPSFKWQVVSTLAFVFMLALLSGCGGDAASVAQGPGEASAQPTGTSASSSKPPSDSQPIKNAFAQPTVSQNGNDGKDDMGGKEKPAPANKSKQHSPLPTSDPTPRVNQGPGETPNPREDPKPKEPHPAEARTSVSPLRMEPPLTADEAKALGLRRLDGQHLILYTDLPAAPEVDELPHVFDLATPMWCKYFQVPPAEAKQFRLVGSLMVNKQRFIQARLLPNRMPPFLNGFQQGGELWLYDQPTAYYRRHLLLHEGVHGFMNWRFGGCGPPWYMEGMAELLATHRWAGGKLQVGYSPRAKEEAPHWGRVRIIRDDYQAGRGLMIDQVYAYGPQAHLKVEPYGWSWAATNFLDRHPTYQKAFRSMPKHGNDNGPFFNEQFVSQLGATRPQLDIEWQVYIEDMQYGYDVARSAIEFRPSQPLPSDGASVVVAADRGWQCVGVALRAGTTYRLTASGQFQIAIDKKSVESGNSENAGQPWIAEANGVTIRYHREQPLGRLLAAVESWERRSNRQTTLVKPIAIGADGLLTPERDGDLFLQLNDSPAERDDNQGQVQVRIAEAP